PSSRSLLASGRDALRKGRRLQRQREQPPAATAATMALAVRHLLRAPRDDRGASLLADPWTRGSYRIKRASVSRVDLCSARRARPMHVWWFLAASQLEANESFARRSSHRGMVRLLRP